jgi:predicted metal-dependent phosphoesterase TrpH
MINIFLSVVLDRRLSSQINNEVKIMGKADLHLHTVYSWDGTCTVEAVLKQAAHVAQLDIIAITDHDEIRGALEAVKLASRYGITVIPGSEISTSDGHLLALFIREKIPAGLTLPETTLRVAEQGGICLAPHPEAKGTQSLSRSVLQAALQDPVITQTLLGVETYNAGLFDQKANLNAEKIAQDLSLARVGNSDSHLLWTIGRGVTLFPGHSVIDLYTALRNRQTIPSVIKKTGFIPVIFSWLRGYLLRRVGWVENNRFPEAPVRLERIPAQAKFALADE